MKAIETIWPTAKYKEYAPCVALRPYVACLWSQTVSKATKPFAQVVLPDGCADIIWVGANQPIAVGPATCSFTEMLPAGCSIVGARFRMGACRSFLKIPATELHNRQINLSELLDRAIEGVTDKIHAAATTAEKIAAVETGLLQRLPRVLVPDHMVQAAIAQMRKAPATRVRDLSKTIGICERQLLRRFSDAVGYGPKMFARIMRLQQFRALAVESTRQSISLVSLASDLGYADQAHMTREVSVLSGFSPLQLFTSAPTLQTVSCEAGI